MKNTFNKPRKKVNGLFPYVIELEKTIYLFEITKNTSLKRIMDIEQKFLDDDKIIFASKDKTIFDKVVSVDAANLYDVGNRKRRKVFYYNNGVFYNTEIIVLKTPDNRECKRLRITNKQVLL